MELLELLKSAQGLGISAPDLIFLYFLYRIDKNFGAVRTANEVLTDTLLRLVPGFRSANEEARKDLALKAKEVTL